MRDSFSDSLGGCWWVRVLLRLRGWWRRRKRPEPESGLWVPRTEGERALAQAMGWVDDAWGPNRDPGAVTPLRKGR